MVQCYFAVQEGPGRAATGQPCPPADRCASPSSSDFSAASKLALQLAERKACLETLRCDIVEPNDVARLAAVADCLPRGRVVEQLDAGPDVPSRRCEARNERRKAVTSCCGHECCASPQPRETAATCGLSPSPVQIRKASNPDGTYEGF